MLILLPNLNVSKRLCMDNAHRRSVLAFTLSVIMGALSMLESIYCHYKKLCFDLALVCKVQLFGVSDDQIFNTWLVSVLRQHNKKNIARSEKATQVNIIGCQVYISVHRLKISSLASPLPLREGAVQPSHRTNESICFFSWRHNFALFQCLC